MCGTTRPTKPIDPAVVMAAAIEMEEIRKVARRTRPTRTPSDCATVSPSSITLSARAIGMASSSAAIKVANAAP